MKKILVIAIVTSFMAAIAGSAMAFPVDFSGEFDYQFRVVSDAAQKGDRPADFSRLAGAFNFSGKIDDNATVFGRFSGLEAFGGKWDGSQKAPSTSNNWQLDNFGVKGKIDNWNYSLGREGVSLGQGGIVATGDLIGYPTYFDGLIVSTQIDAVNFKAIVGRINGIGDNTDSKLGGAFVGPNQAANDSDWVGAEISTTFGKTTVGFAAANEHFDTNINTTNVFTNIKYYAPNISIAASDRLAFNAEYVKSDCLKNNSAYDVSATYSWDKDSFTLAYNYVNVNGVDPVNSGLGNVNYALEGDGLYGYKGVTGSYNHKISKNLALSVTYMQLQGLGQAPGANKNTDGEGQVQLKWTF